MMKIDARGMSCPQPVLMTKKEIDKSTAELEIILDSMAAKNNVERILKSSGYKYSSSESIDDIIIKARKE